jgi:lysophospholipase L1-like esterase
MSPADIRVIRLGNRRKYYRNYEAYPAFRYRVDQIELTDDVPAPPATAPLPDLAKVLARLQARQAVHILCLGDSITAGAGLRAQPTYPAALQKLLRERFGYDGVTVEGWGIGGATLLDALPWIPWNLSADPPDLVTVLYGTNDCSAYSKEFFGTCIDDFLARVSRAAGGKTAVLPIATPPGQDDYFTKADPYAETVRRKAAEHELPCMDLHKTLKDLGRAGVKPYFYDGVHPNAAGHQLIADKIAEFLARQYLRPASGPASEPARTDRL